MPDQTHVGREYHAPGQRIDPDRVERFAAALAGDDPVAEPQTIPPTYAAVYCMFPVLGQLFTDAEVGIDLAGLIHGDQSFAWHAPVGAGDVLDAHATIASVEDKRGMTFVGVELGASRDDGTSVLTGRSTLIIRGASG